MAENIFKKCFKCGESKCLTDFYKHKLMPDGHLNKCKECTKMDVKKRESLLRKDEEWLEKERERNRERYYRLNYKDKWKPNTKTKKETIKKYRQKYPEKYLASKYTEIFLDKNKGLHLHHWSYSEEDWLDVIEIDIKNHNLIHRFLIYNPDSKKYSSKEGVLLDTKEKHLSYINQIIQEFKNKTDKST